MDAMDDGYIWQRRIAHGVRHQKGAVPFPQCVQAGVDFNAAVDRKQKLERHLLTNGVMMEICDFARTVNKSEKYFLFEMLDFNFNLGLDAADDQRAYLYLTRIHSRIKLLKEQIKTKPEKWSKAFVLPDPNAQASDSEVSATYCPRWNKMADTSLLTHGGDDVQSETSRRVCSSKGNRRMAFSVCTELGVSPVVRQDGTPRRKLQRHLVTSGVMLELLNFSKVLCGTYLQIVYDLIKQNFGFEPDKLRLRFSLHRLMDVKRLTGEDRDVQQRETFQITKQRKRKQPDTKQEVGSNQRRRFALRERVQQHEGSYMCPVDCETEDKEVKQEVDVSGRGVDPVRRRLWRRRAALNLLDSDGANTSFSCCRRVGLDLDPSSGGSRKLDVRLLTNGVLQEVHLFASAVSRSTRRFLFHVLNNNFLLTLQDEQQERDFVFSVLLKEKLLQQHPQRDSAAFLRSPAHISETNMEAAPQVESSETSPQDEVDVEDVETHPYCRRLGLDLWSPEERPAGQKLELSALTVGAMLELVAFVRELCGTACDTVTDILEHNFPLDLRSGKMEAASQAIRDWYRSNKTDLSRTRTDGWAERRVQLETRTDPEEEPVPSFPLCRRIGLTLDVRGGPGGAGRKLDPGVLTRGVLAEVHRYVQLSSRHYVPALYAILDHNFDLTSQNHRKVEFAWSLAQQVIAMATKRGKKAAYRNTVFELPFEEPPAAVCKEEEEETNICEDEKEDGDEVVFIRTLRPVDIMVEVE